MKMKESYIFLTVCCLALCVSGFAQKKSVPQGKPITLNISNKMQTIEGWGSSLCWWAGQVSKWEDQKIDSIITYITSPDYMNMNIFRYNIGGGDDPVHIDGHMLRGKGKRAEMEGFKASKDAPYNWEADQAQRKIMLKIKEKRPDAIFEAFSNSAPYWMTYSGCSGGNDDPLKDNLKPEYYEMFCDYLIDVCKHYKEAYHLEFKTLEPFNEALSGYWVNQGSQEGCHFEPQSQIDVLRILYPKLKASGLNTVIAASDETNLEHTLKIQKAYRDAGDIMPMIGQINTHTYSGTNEERALVYDEIVSKVGKTFWQSETGPSEGHGLFSNLMLTKKMFNDMRIMQPVAWLDWQIMEGGTTWCTITGDFRTREYCVNKNTYVRMQITRFFRQGYTLIKTEDEQMLAAISPDRKEMVVAVLNTGESEESYCIDLSQCGKIKGTVSAFRTSKEENCLVLEPIKVSKKTLNYTCPPLSLTTFVLQTK